MKTIVKYTNSNFPSDVFLELTEIVYGVVKSDKLPKPSAFREISYFMMENDRALATATVYSNSKLRLDENPMWMIGNFEAIEGDCHSLFDQIESDARDAGVNQLIGPMNGSTWEEHRFVIDQFGAPFLSEMNHPRYYPELWRQNGFETDQNYYSFKDTEIVVNNEQIEKLEAHFASLNLRIRTVDLTNFEQELERIYEVCLLAFRNNVLYSEISKEQFIASYLPFHAWLNDDYIWIAENTQKECLGFLFAFENKLNSSENELIVKTIARHPSKEFNGMGTILGNKFMRKAIANGATSIIHAFVHEQNTSKNLSQRFNGDCIRTYALFTKKLRKL